MRTRLVARLVSVIAVLPAALGCSHELMPTPNLYRTGASQPFAEVPEPLQTTSVDLLFATDRVPSPREDGSFGFGSDRSRSLAFGSCVVRLGDEALTWDELVEHSTTAKRTKALPVTITSITELGRLAETPMAVVHDAAGVRPDPEAERQQQQGTDALRAEIARRVALSSGRDVLILVHGFNNTFEDAAIVLAELSHFLGRGIVPILYSWPAGAGGGFLRGYNRDRESGEFTIFHLKQFLRIVASCPEVERINILAHSRGTDVTTSALRELFLESKGSGADFRTQYRLHNLILAAADLDLEVVMQRMTAERMGAGVGRITLYVSSEDKAIGLSEWLFGSLRRLGRIQKEDLAASIRVLPNKQGLTIIDARPDSGFLGHGYFHDDPAVSSDLILLLREDRSPGAENGRPLVTEDRVWWTIDRQYPFQPNTPGQSGSSDQPTQPSPPAPMPATGS